MPRIRIPCLIAWAVLGVGPTRADESDRFFQPEGTIATFKVSLDAENLEKIRRDPRQYAKCTVEVRGQTYSEVGVHIKGAAGSFRQWDDKPALTLSFNRHRRSQLFCGMDKIHLNNSVQDPRYMTEILCGDLMLAAGIPAARGTHALVELNGKKAGLYVVKEGFDTAFLKRHFKSAAGNLYDGGFLSDIDSPLKRTHGTDDVGDRSDLRAAAAASRERDLTQRYAKVDKLVDVDRFMKMTALEVITVHWDGYAPHKNNYRVYHDLKLGKLVFIPHGMDQMWGDPNWPIRPGFEGLIARKLMETIEGREAYDRALNEALEKHHKPDQLATQIDGRLAWLKAQLGESDAGLVKDIENHCAGLKSAIRARHENMVRQLKKP
ncbi:MAG: CotH kinase family protein [Gemmataceae bacterium]|nr:CotH kinase family protein [Gemmataceae bacterium]